MSMESLQLLPELEKLPTSEADLDFDFDTTMKRMADIKRDQWSIEFSTGVEQPLMSLFDARNIPDDVERAYRLAFSNSGMNLHDHYAEILARGDAAAIGFISNLKGKLAEMRIQPMLEEQFPGYDFSIAADPTQPIWDIRGISHDGAEDILVQVKLGGESYASEVLERMESTPDVYYAVSREIWDRIAETRPDLITQLINTDIPILEFTQDVKEGLELLAENWGLDVPDSIGDILPFVSEIFLGIKLIMKIISTKKDYKDADFEDQSKVFALKALVLMGRFGIATVCTSLGGAAGTIAIPGWGTLAGAAAGVALAIFLNRRLKPRMMEVATILTGVDDDELFYLRNKATIDGVGLSLAGTVVA